MKHCAYEFVTLYDDHAHISCRRYIGLKYDKILFIWISDGIRRYVKCIQNPPLHKKCIIIYYTLSLSQKTDCVKKTTIFQQTQKTFKIICFWSIEINVEILKLPISKLVISSIFVEMPYKLSTFRHIRHFIILCFLPGSHTGGRFLISHRIFYEHKSGIS